MIRLLISVVLPLGVLCIATLIDDLVEHIPSRRRLTKVGWELCVLAMGLTGATFADDGVSGRFGNPMAIILALFSFMFGLGSITLISHWRARRPEELWTGIAALILGAVSVAIPGYLMFSS